MAFDDQSEGQPSPEALAAVQQFSSAAPSQAPEVSAQGDAPSDEARRAVAAFLAEPAAEKAAKPGRAAPPHPITPLAPRSPVAPKGPTRYMAAVAKPKPAERELTLGQTAQGFAKNLLPSTGEALEGVWSAVTNPGETFGAMKQLGTGAISKGAGAFGQKQNAATKAKDESMLNALLGHYKQTYGSAAGFKKALATDPASILMDASTAFGGAGLAAKGAGFAKTASALGKVSEFSDPIQLALKAAKLPVKAVGKVAPTVQSFTTGKQAVFLAKAAEAATAKATPEQRAAFKSQMTKRNGPELVAALDDGLEAALRKKSTEYVDGMKAATNGVLPPLNWQGLNAALADNFNSIQFRDPNTGFAITKHPNAERALQEIATAANQFASQPLGSTAHTLEGFDALKQMIGDIRSGYKNDPQAYRVATDMYNKTLKEIGVKHPEYADIMKQYASASDEIKAMKDQFGVGRYRCVRDDRCAHRAAQESYVDISGVDLIRAGKREPQRRERWRCRHHHPHRRTAARTESFCDVVHPHGRCCGDETAGRVDARRSIEDRI